MYRSLYYLNNFVPNVTYLFHRKEKTMANIKCVPTAEYDAVVAAAGKYVEGLYRGNAEVVAEAFHKDASGTHIYLPGVMSRKKQIIPPSSEIDVDKPLTTTTLKALMTLKSAANNAPNKIPKNSDV